MGRVKRTNEEVIELLKSYDLEIIEKNFIYENNTSSIICLDKNKYKVCVKLNNLLRGKIPAPFHKNNPYTLENIKLFLKNNNPNLILMSESYIDAEKHLKCKCLIDNNIWYASWENLKSGTTCPICSYNYRGDLCRLNLDDIKVRLNKINPNIEIISNIYVNVRTVLTLKCKLDGHIWRSNWNNLFQKHKCPKCSYKEMDGGYNKTIANRNKLKWLKKFCLVYIINCFNDNENFFKIGLTQRTIKQRFCRKKEMPYQYKILFEFHMNLYDSIYLEQELINLNFDNKYIPKIIFEGYTECFDNINLTKITNAIKKYNVQKIIQNY